MELECKRYELYNVQGFKHKEKEQTIKIFIQRKDQNIKRGKLGVTLAKCMWLTGVDRYLTV
jgi:hypothetical protein